MPVMLCCSTLNRPASTVSWYMKITFEHDPADGKQPIAGAVDRSRPGQPGRHVEAEDRGQQRGGQAQQGGVVRLDVAERQRLPSSTTTGSAASKWRATSVRWGRSPATRERLRAGILRMMMAAMAAMMTNSRRCQRVSGWRTRFRLRVDRRRSRLWYSCDSHRCLPALAGLS